MKNDSNFPITRRNRIPLDLRLEKDFLKRGSFRSFGGLRRGSRRPPGLGKREEERRGLSLRGKEETCLTDT